MEGKRARAGQKVVRSGTKSGEEGWVAWREAGRGGGNAVGSVKGKKWGWWRRAGG